MQGTYSKINYIVIKRAQETDLESVFSIENQEAIVPWTKEMFIGSLKLYDFIIAVDKKSSKVVGYGIIVIHAAICEAHILNLAVDQHYQRLGIGSLLLSNLINLVKLATNKQNADKNQIESKIFLDVCNGNHPAIALYKKFKFIEVGVRKEYYNTRNGKQDAIVYVLNCNGS